LKELFSFKKHPVQLPTYFTQAIFRNLIVKAFGQAEMINNSLKVFYSPHNPVNCPSSKGAAL